MAQTELRRIVRHLDQFLNVDSIEDWPAALNGLQVENSGRVTKIAAAVDGTLATVTMAVEAKADLLLVHHGIFWSPRQPWVGPHYELLKMVAANDLAIYSAHLPLDVHATVGNNALMGKALGLKNPSPFFFHKGRHLGLKFAADIPREALAQRLKNLLGDAPRVLAGGPARCKKIGLVTGGAGDQLQIAVNEGVDTFVTGEGAHWTFGMAEELGINLLYGGHYATEVFGVKALAEYLSRKFGVPSVFLDHPTGL